MLAASRAIAFKATHRRERYGWVESVLKRFRYFKLSRFDKGLVKAYLERLSGFSRAQITRLIAACLLEGAIRPAPSRRNSFTAKYTATDKELLAQTDNAHGRLSGPATKAIFQRQYSIYGDKRFVRLKEISVAHKQLQEEQQASEQAIQADAELKKSRDAVVADVTRQLQEAAYGAGTKSQKALIESAAEAWGNHYVSEGVRRNVDPYELFKKELDAIRPGEQVPIGAANVILIHHGETAADSSAEPSAEEREQGILPVPQTHGDALGLLGLNANGKAQVAAVAPQLREMSQIISGESARTRETARAISENAKVDPRFNAIDIGDHGGMPVTQFRPLLETELEKAAKDPDYKLFGKQTFADWQARNLEALRDAVQSGKPVGLALNSDSMQLFRLMAENGGRPLEGDVIKRMAEKDTLRPAQLVPLQVDPATGEIIGRLNQQGLGYLGRQPLTITGEAIPTTKLQHPINAASPQVKKEFTGKAIKLLDDLGAKLGVDLKIGQASGGYENAISPNILAEMESTGDDASDRAKIDQVARAIQFAFKQDAVPWFRPVCPSGKCA